MKKIGLMAATLALLCSCQPKETPEQAANKKKEAALSVIFSRKSVREYTPQEVKKEDLLTLVKAGMAAPTARNLQPWQFIVITERAILDSLAELTYAKMLLQAQAAIVVCGDTTKTAGGEHSYWQVDCAAATENILLAAEAMGLGAVWTAAFPYQDRIDIVRKNLDFPENWMPLNVIPIGYPAKEESPKDKFKEEKIHWNPKK